MSLEYSIDEDGTLELISGPYVGVTYRYGRVELIPQDDAHLTLRFEYDLVEGDVGDKPSFESYIGRILEEMIHEQLAAKHVVYTGGT